MSTFQFTGSAQTFVVPQGVCALDIQVWGAQGGISGGLGGYARGRLSVFPSQQLLVYVGGQGQAVTLTNVPGGGGFNGGGNAVAFVGSQGGGGGGTDVRTGPDPATRLIVAGGGGGSSAGSPASGAGGGLVGTDGTQGQAGTQTAGGAGAGPGSFFFGGDTTSQTFGKGGGGGWYGGGASSNDPTLTTAGGGSGYVGRVTSGQFQTGVREGNGLAIITPIACPGQKIITASTKGCSARIFFKTDPKSKFSPPSGSCFPLGDTRVTVTRGQRTSLAFIVRVTKQGN